MKQFFILRGRAVGRALTLLLVLAAGLSLCPGTARASHIRAGDIQAKVDTTANPNPRRIFFKMVLYTTEGPNVVDQAKVTIFFGDGTSSCLETIPRQGGRRPIPGSTDTGLNIYTFEHTYSSVGSFVVSFVGENRITGVLNLDQSDRQSFYISTRVTIDPALGLNHSPVLRAPAIDKGAIGQVFLHNPAAYDADGDSLAFHLRNSQQVPMTVESIVGAPCVGRGDNQPVPGTTPNFRYPNDPALTPGNPPVQVPYNGTPSSAGGGPAIFEQDVNTGTITWNAPVQTGVYNVAMVVEEWRRTALGRRLIGQVVRDMQITVLASTNLRPTVTVPADVCVIAGQRVTGTITATDASSPSSPATAVTLYAYTGIIPPATFVQTQSGPPLAQATFSWQTECSNVARLPYLVVFKAQDSPSPVSPSNPILIDEKVWRITVVGPPPQGLRATAAVGTDCNVNTAVLNWNNYQCANASYIYIYRKVGPSGFVPGPCITGIPASAGYTLVDSVQANETAYTDRNVGPTGAVRGLDRGQTYCYRIFAKFPFPASGSSIASQEVCVSFPGRAARLTNVDVQTTTTTTGQVLVRWTQPRSSTGSFAGITTAYELSRGEGLNPTVFAPVRSFAALTDTSFVDSGLNTQDIQYTYKLDFVRTFAPAAGCAPVRETAPTASTVRVTAVPNRPPTAFNVRWTYNVPWDNSAQPVNIYRRPASGGPFVLVGTAPTGATGGTYFDNDRTLIRDSTYCYYVQTTGRYAGVAYLSALVNKSQQQCVALNNPPCTPVLTLKRTDCDELANRQEFPKLSDRYTNTISWEPSSSPEGCDAAIASYYVYYRPTLTGRFTRIGTTTQTTFTHANLEFSAGCYAVQAVGRSGLVSDTSNVDCQDNCLFFKLPNIFTPSGDGVNDIFRPKNHSPIRSVRFQAFNRWGVKVFENTTTAKDRTFINWDGGGPVGEATSSGKVADGIYYYLAEVEFADFANTRRTYKGWVEIVR